MIMRIIVLGALLLLLVKGYKSVEKQFAYVADVTRTGVTKAELNKIRGLILTDLLAYNGCRFPIMDDEEWGEYIRKNLASAARGRDFAEDLWGTPFRVREADRFGSDPGHDYEVRSAGPDSMFDTPDDIVATGTCTPL